MVMFDETFEIEGVILCAASAYEQKYYFNPDFEGLPVSVQEELQIMCVLYTAEIGGILTLHFDDSGNLLIHVTAREGDLHFAEIAIVILIKKIDSPKREILEAMEFLYKYKFLQEDIGALLEQ